MSNDILPVRVSDELRSRIKKAAKRFEQTMSDWVRMAIIEKLERDKK